MKILDSFVPKFFNYLESKGKTFNFLLGILFVTLIGVIDISAPDEATHSFLYLIPVSIVTWFSGIWAGLGMALIGTAFWSVNNITASIAITTWNILSTIFFFSAIAALLHKTHVMWINESSLSRTDPLTGAKNTRAFTEIAEYEILRSQREGLPFSLAYLDLDNFKIINDTYGHAAGDTVLKIVVTEIVKNLRKTDVVARLGGDEFAIFFPETDQSSVQIVMEKVKEELKAVAKSNSWPTTFSIGVLTCSKGTCDLDAMITTSDRLMYAVKNKGKNNINYDIYPSNNNFVKEQGA